MKNPKNYIVPTLLTSITASLCCITPVIAIISGATGFASTFSWLDPMRPFLIGLTICMLAFTWYLKLKPNKEIDCECDETEGESMFQGKAFLAFVTVFSLFTLAFPMYSKSLVKSESPSVIIVDKQNIESITLIVKGMTCAGCESSIESLLNKLIGVITVDAIYDSSSVYIQFDKTKVSRSKIIEEINKTGYIVQKDEVSR